MDYKKYNAIYKNNLDEIGEITAGSGKYKNLNDSEKNDRIKCLEDVNKAIATYVTKAQPLEEEIKVLAAKDSLTDVEEKKLKETRKKYKEAQKTLAKQTSRGKFRDVVSSLFSEADKRIHNKRYAGDKKIEKWNNHCDKVNSRYTTGGLIAYFGIRAAIIAGVARFLMPHLAVAGLAGIATAALTVGGAVTVAKTIATIYNKVRYGGPRLEQRYDVKSGGFFNNSILRNPSKWIKNIKSYGFKYQKNHLNEDSMGNVAPLDALPAAAAAAPITPSRTVTTPDATIMAFVNTLNNEIDDVYGRIDSATKTELKTVLNHARKLSGLLDADRINKLNAIVAKSRTTGGASPAVVGPMAVSPTLAAVKAEIDSVHSKLATDSATVDELRDAINHAGPVFYDLDRNDTLKLADIRDGLIAKTKPASRRAVTSVTKAEYDDAVDKYLTSPDDAIRSTAEATINKYESLSRSRKIQELKELRVKLIAYRTKALTTGLTEGEKGAAEAYARDFRDKSEAFSTEFEARRGSK